jgi:hypothetical protein
MSGVDDIKNQHSTQVSRTRVVSLDIGRAGFRGAQGARAQGLPPDTKKIFFTFKRSKTYEYRRMTKRQW